MFFSATSREIAWRWKAVMVTVTLGYNWPHTKGAGSPSQCLTYPGDDQGRGVGGVARVRA
jgi:hypothetical protein